MVKIHSKILLVTVIGLAVIASGCTGGQDVTSVVKALPEVQQFMKEHPNAQITVTYWSKEEVAQSAQEISQQCDKPITPVAMYKATVSEGNLKIVSWIDADNRMVLCSITQGSSETKPTSTVSITSTSPEAPQASLVISSTSASTDSLTITHRGGDSIDLSKTKAIIEQDMGRMTIATLSSTTETFQVGDELGFFVNTNAKADVAPYAVYLNKAAMVSGAVSGQFSLTSGRVTVTIIDTDSAKEIAKIMATVPAMSEAPEASLVISSASASTDNLIITHRGGDLIDLSKTKAIIEQDMGRMTIATLSSTTEAFQVGDELGFFVNTNAKADVAPYAVYLDKAAMVSGAVSGQFSLTSGRVTVTIIDTDSVKEIAKITAIIT